MIKQVFTKFFKLWLLGILFLLVILGYLLYSIVWFLRLVQMKKITLLISVMILLIAGLFSAYYLFLPIGFEKQSIEIIIPSKSTVRSVADTLKNHRIITNAEALRFWMKFRGTERKIQAGRVTFLRGDGVLRAARKLLHAEPLEVAVMIFEGLTIEQVAQRLYQGIKIDTVEFVKLCYDTSFMTTLSIRAPSLEGYLFPNTYRFPEQISTADIIRIMVKQFELAYASLAADTRITSKYTKHEIVTLASIVEKEATLPSERNRIAGVFHNRLKIGYPLGADPTVRYALKKFKGPLRVSELNNNSPYNTRKFTGLPPGPICSPGKGCLQAAIAPAETKDLYFVAKWDGSGEHDFSVTNEEHTRKKLAIRRLNEMRLKNRNTSCKTDSVK
jgi:UPF0755 protein